MFKLKPVFQSYFDRHINNDEVYRYLSANSSDGALDILITNREMIDWEELSSNTNPRALWLLKKNPTRIDWYNLSANPADEALDLLEANVNRIDWYMLCKNTNDRAFDLLDANPKKVILQSLVDNVNDRALKYFKSDMIDIERLYSNSNEYALRKALFNVQPEWDLLSSNSNETAVKIMLDNPACIDWNMLCSNTNPKALKLLEDNIDKINWYTLSENPNAVYIFEQNPKFIGPDVFIHPTIFEIDTSSMIKSKVGINDEAVSIVMHPDNYHYFMNLDL